MPVRYEVRPTIRGVANERFVVWDTLLNRPAYRWASGVAQEMHFGYRVRADLACRDMNASAVNVL